MGELISPAMRKKRLAIQAEQREKEESKQLKHEAVSEFNNWVGRNKGLSDKLLNEYKHEWLETM